jgi:hypothetical protein
VRIFKNNGFWARFVCPRCDGRAQRLRLLDEKSACGACVRASGLIYRSQATRTEKRYAVTALPRIARLNGGGPFRVHRPGRTVRDLDADVVIEVLSRHAVNVSEAARELEVNSADLRRLLWARPQLAAAAAEMEERRLDIAERNILEALTSGDPRMRMASAMFTVRYSAKARKRGWITNSSASVDANAVADAEPKHYRVVWSKPDVPERELGPGEFVRDGRILSVPDYGGEPRDDVDDDDRHDADDIVEGHLVQRSPMIEHEAAEPIEASEPHSAVVEPEPPAPESAAARYARERIDAWVRARLIAYPLAVCFLCRRPFVAGAAWEEASNGEVRMRFHRDCHTPWRAEQEAAARRALGLPAEPEPPALLVWPDPAVGPPPLVAHLAADREHTVADRRAGPLRSPLAVVGGCPGGPGAKTS